MRSRTTDELIQIVAAGGGLILDAAPRPTNDLIQIASAASGNRVPLQFRGMDTRPTSDLIQIAAAARGCVMFE